MGWSLSTKLTECTVPWSDSLTTTTQSTNGPGTSTGFEGMDPISARHFTCAMSMQPAFSTVGALIIESPLKRFVLNRDIFLDFYSCTANNSYMNGKFLQKRFLNHQSTARLLVFDAIDLKVLAVPPNELGSVNVSITTVVMCTGE